MCHYNIEILKTVYENEEVKTFIDKCSFNHAIVSSSSGVEIIIASIEAISLVVAIIQIPTIIRLFEKKQLIIKYKNIELKNNVRELLKVININEKMRLDILTAYKNDKLFLLGDVKNIHIFTEKLDLFLKNYEEK